ncbi:hypothetical protein FOCC_FOCC012512, partial [Frankliniella occidentalis]
MSYTVSLNVSSLDRSAKRLQSRQTHALLPKLLVRLENADRKAEQLSRVVLGILRPGQDVRVTVRPHIGSAGAVSSTASRADIMLTPLRLSAAPNAYNPDVHDHAPEYTFGLRTQIERPNGIPASSLRVGRECPRLGGTGRCNARSALCASTTDHSLTHALVVGPLASLAAPNVYNIPSVLGKTLEGNKKAAPAFSISGRQKEPQDERALVPGPGAYEPSVADCYNNHNRSPAYSISSRFTVPSDATLKPGPGAHCPEK